MYDNLSKYEFKASFRSWENKKWKCSILHNFHQRSEPIWADRVAFLNFLHFSKNKTRWTFCIFFSKIVHQKGLFEKIKKNSNFWCCLGILDIYGRAFLNVYGYLFVCLFVCLFRVRVCMMRLFHFRLLCVEFWYEMLSFDRFLGIFWR